MAPGKPRTEPQTDAVERADGDPIERGRDPLILCRIERLIGFDVVIAPAVPVGVQHEGRPSLRFPSSPVSSSTFRFSQPTTPLPGPPALVHSVLVASLGEHEMVRLEARANKRELAGLRVVHREMPVGLVRAGRAGLTDGSSPCGRRQGSSGGRTREVNQTRP